MFSFFVFSQKIRAVRRKPKTQRGRKIYLKYKKSAGEIIKKRVAEINQFYNFPYNKISIRNQETRWGSCSKKGNLNFNYRIALLPRKYTDYIIVHELCHLKEFNHSKRFWALVAQTVPQHKKIRKEIRKMATSKMKKGSKKIGAPKRLLKRPLKKTF